MTELIEKFPWLVPLITGVVAMVGIWISAPKRWKLAFFVTSLVALLTIWSIYKESSEHKKEETLRAYHYVKLSSKHHKLLGVLSNLIVLSSDGWLPRTNDEFFSKRVAQMICKELNVEAGYPFSMQQDIRQVLFAESKAYKDYLTNILEKHGKLLNAELIGFLQEVEQSVFLELAIHLNQLQLFDNRIQVQRAPIFVGGGASQICYEFLVSLHKLTDEITKIEKQYQIQKTHSWLDFPDHFTEKYLGTNRFSKEDLADWFKQHPNAPPIGFFGVTDKSANKIEKLNPPTQEALQQKMKTLSK